MNTAAPSVSSLKSGGQWGWRLLSREVRSAVFMVGGPHGCYCAVCAPLPAAVLLCVGAALKPGEAEVMCCIN